MKRFLWVIPKEFGYIIAYLGSKKAVSVTAEKVDLRAR